MQRVITCFICPLATVLFIFAAIDSFNENRYFDAHAEQTTLTALTNVTVTRLHGYWKTEIVYRGDISFITAKRLAITISRFIPNEIPTMMKQ